MNEQPATVSWVETEYSPSQPATYTMEVNGTTYGPLVDLDLYACMREERDALKAWQQDAVKHLEELTAWWEADRVAIPQLVAMRQTAEAERDQAKQELQSLYASYSRLGTQLSNRVGDLDKVTCQRDYARRVAELLRSAVPAHLFTPLVIMLLTIEPVPAVYADEWAI